MSGICRPAQPGRAVSAAITRNLLQIRGSLSIVSKAKLCVSCSRLRSFEQQLAPLARAEFHPSFPLYCRRQNVGEIRAGSAMMSPLEHPSSTNVGGRVNAQLLGNQPW